MQVVCQLVWSLPCSRCTLHTRGLSARLLGARGSVNKRPQASRQRGTSSILIPSSSSPCAQRIIRAMFNLPAEAVVLNQFEDVFHSNLSNFMGVDQEIQSQGIRFSNPLPSIPDICHFFSTVTNFG